MDPVIKVAGEYPKTIFMHCSGEKRQKNVGTYFGRIDQAMYLAGMVAGSMTKTNLLGFVAAHPISEVIRNINAFTLGALSVNPEVRVRVVWTRAWFDPAKEKQGALELLDAGADVLAQHQNSPVVQLAAKERGKYAIGYNTDMSSFAPRTTLTAAVWNWAPFYRTIVKEVRNGTWKSENLVWGIDKGVVDLAPVGPMVPGEVEAKVLAKKAELASGRFHVFAGPVEDQDGHVRIAAGTVPSWDDLLKMTWLVKGTIGKIE
jgi:basic membrane protein A